MNAQFFGKLLVTLQFGLLVALAVLCFWRAHEQAPGVLVYALWLLSIALGVWTLSANRPGNFNIRPEPKAQGRLVKTGPYRWVRHPMYGSVLLLAAGASTWLADVAGLALWVALLLVLMAKAHLEERWLVQHYADYGAYQQQTWRLLPGLY